MLFTARSRIAKYNAYRVCPLPLAYRLTGAEPASEQERKAAPL